MQIRINRILLSHCLSLTSARARLMSVVMDTVGSLGQALFDLDEFGDAIVHLLDGLVFGETQTTSVRDVVNAADSFSVFAGGAAHLQVVFASNFLKLSQILGQFWYFDVHRSTNGGAQVGRAESEETKTIVMREWNTFFDVIDSSHQTLVHLTQVTAHLHRNDAQMIFFVAPDQECFGVVVVNATASWPETASVGSLEETIAFLEQEVIVDQLLLQWKNDFWVNKR